MPMHFFPYFSMKTPSRDATPPFLLPFLAPRSPITASATSSKPISWLHTDINKVAILHGCGQLKTSTKQGKYLPVEGLRLQSSICSLIIHELQLSSVSEFYVNIVCSFSS